MRSDKQILYQNLRQKSQIMSFNLMLSHQASDKKQYDNVLILSMNNLYFRDRNNEPDTNQLVQQKQV